MALGARPQQILKLILGESTRLALAGVLVGAFLGYAAGRGLQSLLAGLDPADTLTFAAVMALAAIMTIVGSALPTLRAVRVDPASVIRST